MKKIGVCFFLIVFAAFTLPADAPDVILQARSDATEDGKNYHALWWGIGGVAVTVLPVVLAGFSMDSLSLATKRAVAFAGPPVGGMSLAFVGFVTGKAEMPDARSARIQEEYDDSRLAELYESEYEQTLSRIQRRKRGISALIGSGAAVGAMGIGFLLVYVTK